MPVVFAASMEMNESSRWTEEEMETAKKGKAPPRWCAARLSLAQALGCQS